MRVTRVGGEKELKNIGGGGGSSLIALVRGPCRFYQCKREKKRAPILTGQKIRKSKNNAKADWQFPQDQPARNQRWGGRLANDDLQKEERRTAV